MKILYIANARIPTEKAHGIHIMKMCEAFSRLDVRGSKFDVELVIPRRINWIKDDPLDYYGIERNFKITRLPCLDLIIFDKLIGIMGLWVESVTFFVSLFFYALFKKADVFYSRDKYSLPLVFFKKNFISEIHTFPKNYGPYKQFFKRVKMIVVLTQGLKNLFIGKGISPEKIFVAPDGVDLKEFQIPDSRFQIRERFGLPQDKKIALYTGHLYEWKGAVTLLETARNFQFPISNFQFVFVGGTEEDIRIFRAKARDLNNVLIVGHRPHSEIPYWLKAADVLVMPNSGKEEISRHWTSPLKMFEYMASGRPIVASDLPSIREILNETNAVLVEPDNPERLADGIKAVLQNPGLSDSISTEAALSVKKYTWIKRAQNIWQKIF